MVSGSDSEFSAGDEYHKAVEDLENGYRVHDDEDLSEGSSYVYDDDVLPVEKKVECALRLHKELEKLQKKRDEEIERIKKKYDDKIRKNLDARLVVLKSNLEDEEQEDLFEDEESKETMKYQNSLGTPGIPGFWLSVMLRSGLTEFIYPQDHDCLRYIEDIRCEDSAKSYFYPSLEHCVTGDEFDRKDQSRASGDQSADVKTSMDESAKIEGFTVVFRFAESNPYFRNREIKKVCRIKNRNYVDEIDILGIESTPIEWRSPEMNLTILTGAKNALAVAYGQQQDPARKEQQQRRLATELEKNTEDTVCRSFFCNFFRTLGICAKGPEVSPLTSPDIGKSNPDVPPRPRSYFGLTPFELRQCLEAREAPEDILSAFLSEHYETMTLLRDSIIPHAIVYYQKMEPIYEESEVSDVDSAAGSLDDSDLTENVEKEEVKEETVEAGEGLTEIAATRQAEGDTKAAVEKSITSPREQPVKSEENCSSMTLESKNSESSTPGASEGGTHGKGTEKTKSKEVLMVVD